MFTELLIPSCSAIRNNGSYKNWKQHYDCSNDEFVDEHYEDQQSSSYTNHFIKGQNQSNDELNNYYPNNNNKNFDKNNYDMAYVRNTVAQAVITRLHRWCCQLFWLTIVCVMGCCGELQKSKSKSKTIAEVRRNIFNNSLRRCKDLNDLEVQVSKF